MELLPGTGYTGHVPTLVSRRPRRAAPFLAGLAGLAVAAAAVAPAIGADGAGGAPPTPYYLALGASESLGVQPSSARTRTGAPTDDGYANAVVAMERSRWPGLRLQHFGCTGITVQGALSGGGRCKFPGGSEVASAVQFLRAHPGQTVLATVDLGFNDLWPCLDHRSIDPACVTAALARISSTLPVVLRDLRAAGGPHMRIVGLLHNDPYLASYRHGATGRAFSATTLRVIDRLNATLTSIYTRAGAGVANVPSVFALGTSSSVRAGSRRLPLDVAKVCALSWECSLHNLHLNAAGYSAIAGAIAAALPPARPQAPAPAKTA